MRAARQTPIFFVVGDSEGQDSRGDKRALFKRALCSLQDFGLNHLTPPFHAFIPPPLLSAVSTLSESKWAIMSPKRRQATQRCHEEQSARSKGARLSPLERLKFSSEMEVFKRDGKFQTRFICSFCER